MTKIFLPKHCLRISAALMFCLLSLAAAPARAFDELDISTYSEVSTDIRARGVSQTYLGPGALADLLFLHSSGAYGRARVSNVSKKIYRDGNGANLQFTFGQRWAVRDTVNFDVGVVADLFPGGKHVVVSGVDPTDGSLISKRNAANTALLQFEAEVGWATLRYSHTLSRNFYGVDSQDACAFIGDELAAFECLQLPAQGTRGSGYVELEGNFRLSSAWSLRVSTGRQFVRKASSLDWNTYALWVTRTQGRWSTALGLEQARPTTAGALDVQEPSGQSIKNLGARRLVGSLRYSF
jgi:hypothetical protein